MAHPHLVLFVPLQAGLVGQMAMAEPVAAAAVGLLILKGLMADGHQAVPQEGKVALHSLVAGEELPEVQARQEIITAAAAVVQEAVAVAAQAQVALFS